MWGDIAIAFLLAFITALFITPYTIKLANKIGAVDTPKEERRVNTKTMPRLRRIGCYSRFFSIRYLFGNCYEFRTYNKFNWSRAAWLKIIRLFSWHINSWYNVLFR